MSNSEDFNKELADLLRKYNAAIVAKSNKDKDDASVEIGFQFGIHNKWHGRHHITAFDMDGEK